MRPLRALALALAALAAACQEPKGSCDTTADCASNERCDAGVCVRTAGPGGDGSGGGTDPGTFTAVYWSTLTATATSTFAPVSIAADATTGDVLVTGGVASPFDPWSLGTGGFAARRAGATGALAGLVRLPTFSHGALRTTSVPGGGILFAGRAVDPTTLGTTTWVPPQAGSLFVGVLSGAGDPVWVVTVDGIGGAEIAPVAVAARGSDLVVAGTGAGDFGCGATAGATFVAALDGTTGACIWSRGLATRSLVDAEARPAGDVAVAGLCAPSGASFDPGLGNTCTSGLYVAVLGASDGQPTWARTSTGAVTAVRDLAVAPSGAVAVVGDAHGSVAIGGGAATDFGALDGSFVKVFTATGGSGPLIRPVEAPTAPLRDEAAFDRCAFDASARLWIAGRYYGQPTLAGLRFAKCRDACRAAAFLARVDNPTATPATGSFLPIRIAEAPGGAAYADDLVLAATAATVSLSLRFSGDTTVGPTRWTTGGAGLGTLRIVP
jgi:hypothetical protein